MTFKQFLQEGIPGPGSNVTAPPGAKWFTKRYEWDREITYLKYDPINPTQYGTIWAEDGRHIKRAMWSDQKQKGWVA